MISNMLLATPDVDYALLLHVWVESAWGKLVHLLWSQMYRYIAHVSWAGGVDSLLSSNSISPFWLGAPARLIIV